MMSHPDADGFIRAILANPADPTPRLIFADWLDDTGRPGNAAWAEYIRARVEYDEITKEVERYLRTVAARIEARLTLPAGAFARRMPHLFELLPPFRFTVTLANEPIPPPVIWELPESVARENLLMPVWMNQHVPFKRRSLVLATEQPANVELAEKMAFILGYDVYLVAAAADDIQVAIDRDYGQTETESSTSLLYEFPVIEMVLHEDRRVN